MAQLSVFAIVRSHSAAEDVVGDLESSGFSILEVSVLYLYNHGQPGSVYLKASKAPESALTWVITDGLLGLLAGFGALAISGVGPCLAAGPIVAVLCGGETGGATGDFADGLIRMGIREIEAKRYEDKLRGGHYLIAVSVYDSDQEDRAEGIFKSAGAEDISASWMSKALATASK